ncbi:unnamed protein product [Penicillium salamii]|uniref:Zn(2)-C6 fungal-type domain-containing protein n=1 Tax=Penicillium salamii TaxID=1612424 RepID=A0A9W4NEE4_9EURO|nr:unnamed protein product [Penicillium salamii]CAG7965992.1 unnamed protein product [Penicillium salamii]CAG7994457.1 unnamed protein product [Penicillium salamii]CAG8018589.1 unnamed protein product [Penicillium salamii]CAG8089118.1 unnamed protein product [Penicillium salamii]
MQGSPESQPQVPGRRKVKTGCKTCKARRVKCDESRPACRRCVSTGRVCNGYGIWGGGDSQSQIQCSQPLSIHRAPVPQGGLTSDEEISFDWFREKTTKQFAGVFTSDFWETLVFQASVQEPAVRHAVVALSAAHRSDDSRDPRALAAPRGINTEHFMLQHYNKAIHHLRSSPVNDTTPDIRVILITCMIFVTLEYLRGQYASGNSHLRYGIQLLSELSTQGSKSSTLSENTSKCMTQATDFAHNALIDSYAQLTMQSAMFGIFPSHMCITTHDSQTYAPPYNFKSIINARKSLDELLHKVKCLKEDYHQALETGNTIDHSKASAAQDSIQKDLLAWRQAYDVILPSLQSTMDPRDRAGSIIVRLYHEMVTVMAAVSLSESEMDFDAYTDRFSAIIAGVHELSQIWSLSATESWNPGPGAGNTDPRDRGFTIESGYIPPIYYTAMKCRIPHIRRQAIQALRLTPRREGLWNGPLLADVLEEVIGIEQGQTHVDHLNSELRCQDSEITGNRLCLPHVDQMSRISDVKVLLPDAMDETTRDTFISYKKMTLDGDWATLEQKIGFSAATG